MKWTERPVILAATHGCPHHLDELVAMALLCRWALAGDRSLDIEFFARDAIETRGPSFDVLVDVGLQFDPSRGRFDHHQGDPDVAGKSSAGLLFDALFADDPVAAYLRPVIRLVDAIDTGTPHRGPAALSVEDRRAANLLSLSTLVKAVGGFQHEPARSRQCVRLMEALVGQWFRQAAEFLTADEVLARARRVAGGGFLTPPDAYGAGLEERLSETDWLFVGFQQTPDRFQVVALRDADGRNRVSFPLDLPGASFVHTRGFLAVFPTALAAEAALATPLPARGGAPCST